MKMSLVIDSKEELHLRMTELQQKLRDSEEERRKLEQTCDVLIKTFKEEHRMQYNALKNKYEKFLEDCNVRRRRNDIILKSLCRVEDKAKAIYAKTEKLKLLKDRYIIYLKQNEFLKAGEPQWKNPSVSLARDLIRGHVTHKSVHWKTPIVADVREYNSKDVYHAREERNVGGGPEYEREKGQLVLEEFSNVGSTGRNDVLDSRVPFDEHIATTKESNVQIPSNGYQERSLFNQHPDSLPRAGENNDNLKINDAGTCLRRPEVVETVDDRQRDSPESAAVRPPEEPPNVEKDDVSKGGAEPIKELPEPQAPPNTADLEEVKVLRERGVLKHQESIDKLKIALEKTDKKNDVEPSDGGDEATPEENETEEKAKKEPEETKVILNEGSVCEKDEEDDEEDEKVEKEFAQMREENSEEEGQTGEGGVTCLKGLDGVDYQNETYPESYYEQPVHNPHNYTSIASNVILEEDEDESETETKDVDGTNPQEKDQAELPEESGTGTGEISDPGSRPAVDTGGMANSQQNQSSDSDQPSTADSEADVINTGKFTTEEQDKITELPVKSNLIHLLESDSESFQIEHGEAISGNDDSDFDFSFGQNEK